MKTTKAEDNVEKCHACNRKKYTTTMFAHPTWKDDNNQIHYEIPNELLHLTEGEKLLLQQISPYVPLQHLQKGSYGCKGHVCSFPQDISTVCNELPRLPSDTSVVNIIREFRDKDNISHQHAFRIRKHKVLCALKWLKQHNIVYKDITIKEENLNWMSASEDYLSHPDQLPNDEQEHQHEQYVNHHDDPNSINKESPIYGMLSHPLNEHNPSEKYNTFTASLESA